MNFTKVNFYLYGLPINPSNHKSPEVSDHGLTQQRLLCFQQGKDLIRLDGEVGMPLTVMSSSFSRTFTMID